MVQGYYSLEEAAKRLGMPAEDLSQLAKKREIRAFQDAGSWKFRTQDIEEMVRARSLGSDPDIRLADVEAPSSQENIDLVSEDDQVILDDSGMPSSASQSEATIIGGRAASSDSDVRLVLSDESKLDSDSDVQLVPDTGSSKRLKTPGGFRNEATIANIDSDSDQVDLDSAPISSGSDSDIRLTFDDSMTIRPKQGDSSARRKKEDSAKRKRLDVTEEIRLDSDAVVSNLGKTSMAKKESDLDFNFDDGDSGFKVEGMSDDMIVPSDSSGDIPLQAVAAVDEKRGSEDPTTAMDAISLSDDEIDLSSSDPSSSGPVVKPSDSAISLEDPESGSDSEFELTLDSDADNIFETDELPSFKEDEDDAKKTAAVPAGKKPAAAKGAKGAEAESESTSSDSDFELAFDEDFESEGESGSEVVAVDEDDESPTVVTEDDESSDEVTAEEEDDGFSDELVAAGTAVGAAAGVAAAGAGRRGAMVAATETSWPGWILAPLLLNLTIMIMAGLMTLEIVRNAVSYNTPYTLSGSLINWVADLKKSIIG